MPRRSILLFAGACLAIAAALAIVTVVVVGNRPSATRGEIGATGQPLVGGDFKLVNQDGQPVDQTMLNGKWSLVFFGFTYCPEFCPTTLAELGAVQQRLGDKADDLQIVFVSIDPERDTPEVVRDFTDNLHPRMIGLTGTPEQVRAAATAYRAVYQKVGEGEGYTMNHSLTVYLMGPDGKFRTAVAYGMGPDKTTRIIEQAMARG